MTKKYEIRGDGSIVFADANPSDKLRAEAYEEAGRQRAAATDVDPEQLVVLARESASLVTSNQRETGTEVQS